MDSTRGRILIIDPDSRSAKLYLQLLVPEGFDVEVVQGVAEAVHAVKDVQFHCVIVDLERVVVKGCDTVPILKAIDPQLQIIVAAAENTMELEAEVRKRDIHYYHIKSFDPEELKQAVRDALRGLGVAEEIRETDGPTLVLVVDDDKTFVDATRLVLESDGYHVEAAYNKAEAMRRIESLKPDLILLDIMMERMNDGFTMCYELKHNPELRRIPILAISAIRQKTRLRFSPNTDGEYFLADDYVEKPVEPPVLVERIRRLVRRGAVQSAGPG